MEGKFKKGDIVYERINPHRKLVVGQLRDGLYYCRLPENRRRLFVYQERELMSGDTGQASTVPIL